MNLVELLKELRNQGYSDPQIADKCRLSQPTITRLRKKTSNFKNIYPATLKALADAFGYELKYEHGEPQFYKKEETPPAIRANPETQKADEIYRFLKNEIGVDNVDDLKQLFNDLGAVLGTNLGEIRDLLSKIRALDIIRGMVKTKEVK